MTTSTEWLSKVNLSWGFNEDEDEHYFNSLTEELTCIMNAINDSGKWHCVVNNFGWQKRNGYKDFDVDNGKGLLNQILPRTDCHFKITMQSEGSHKWIHLQNWHHDSPSGNESYDICRQRDS